ncbi:MAG: FFLEELY motif protein [bacterium]|jgi:hypothetical protein
MPFTPQADNPKDRLTAHLQRVIELRRSLRTDTARARTWLALKRWQSDRLRRSYPDLFAQPRYAAAGEFFLTELYGVRDFEQRDSEALRAAGKFVRMLPERGVQTLLLAVELDELTERLDERVAARLALPIGDAAYARAYREAGTLDERTQQIEMVDAIGRSLERLARVPLLAGMLHMMRIPAEATGYGHLHHFLQSGFDAFKAMGSAGAFLDAVRARETRLMQRLFAGDASALTELPPTRA